LFDETLENAIKFESKTWGSGILSGLNVLSFNAYQQMIAQSQETQIIASRIIIQQNELIRRELEKSNNINKELLEYLKNK